MLPKMNRVLFNQKYIRILLCRKWIDVQVGIHLVKITYVRFDLTVFFVLNIYISLLLIICSVFEVFLLTRYEETYSRIVPLSRGHNYRTSILLYYVPVPSKLEWLPPFFDKIQIPVLSTSHLKLFKKRNVRLSTI